MGSLCPRQTPLGTCPSRAPSRRLREEAEFEAAAGEDAGALVRDPALAELMALDPQQEKEKAIRRLFRR